MRFDGKLCYAGVYGHSQDHDGKTLAVACALITVHSPSEYKESTFGCCRKHLNQWLDYADDNQHLEPKKIKWIQP